MSPGNQGVFQLLKEVIFRRILAFYNLRKWSYFGVSFCSSVRFWLASETGPKAPDDLILSEQIYGVP